MNVLLINGSTHKEGCTYHALCEVAKTLNAAGIETTIYHIGPAPVGGCVGCGGCAKAGHCVFGGPVVDVGLATGTPVLPVMPKVVTFHSRKASATAAAVET